MFWPPIPQGSVVVVEGIKYGSIKKQEDPPSAVMCHRPRWCLCRVLPYMCTMMINRWKGSWVAVLGSTCYVKELMSVRDVWVPQNSYTHAVPGQVHAHSYIIYHVCTLYMNIMYGGTCIHTYTFYFYLVCVPHLVSVLRWHMTQVAGQWERTERIGLSKRNWIN